MPPSAYTGIGLSRTHRAKRIGPMVGAPGWLRVANTGDSSTASTSRAAAKRTARGECAAEVTIQPGRWLLIHGREARRTEASDRCNPSAPIARASRQSLAMNKRTPRFRQSGLMRRAKLRAAFPVHLAHDDRASTREIADGDRRVGQAHAVGHQDQARQKVDRVTGFEVSRRLC